MLQVLDGTEGMAAAGGSQAEAAAPRVCNWSHFRETTLWDTHARSCAAAMPRQQSGAPGGVWLCVPRNPPPACASGVAVLVLLPLSLKVVSGWLWTASTTLRQAGHGRGMRSTSRTGTRSRSASREMACASRSISSSVTSALCRPFASLAVGRSQVRASSALDG